MARRLLSFYQRHPLVSTNLNIIAAGVLAILLAKFPVQWVSDWIGEGYKGLKVVLAAMIDGAFDIGIYLVLHWIANHWRPFGCHDEVDQRAQKSWWRKYLRSVTGIQLERLFLFPLFYGMAMGGMYALMHFTDMREGWAFVAAFFAAILITRVIHTLYWIRTGRFKTVRVVFDDPEGVVAKLGERDGRPGRRASAASDRPG